MKYGICSRWDTVSIRNSRTWIHGSKVPVGYVTLRPSIFLPITCAAQLLLDLRFQRVRIRRTSMQSETSGPGALTASDLSQNHEGAPPSDTKLDAEDTNVLAFEV